MIAIVHSIYSQSVHAPARDAGLMDNDAERYCTMLIMNALLEVEFNKNKQRPIATNHCHWLDQMCFQSDWPFVMTSNIF